ncbi:ribosome silencing factor [Deinococcus cellulosilyticus]|uniref:Ribosomal silencing factor RsfS n=1 Tax=Deinococcus cellulosilyticus (strain DSM 18568 / NBRC 106333 / KACC 11606 / 5516J-15) TaxID=1223518 RepID=A0A511N4I3_DEIC1|nr:ribosome silencing factor [Deinococcus cellulosilyticus]GEM47773.1 ribosomal silencing factor RsfS [Deinococcus cellulosilyticus NBRC 106333 = KACC 11606]
MQDRELIQLIVDAAKDKRAEDVVVLDLQHVSSTLDYFIICTASAGLQINAVQNAVREATKEKGVHALGIEGPSDRWILINFGTVIVHVMTKEARDYYDLEGLWSDAQHVAV